MLRKQTFLTLIGGVALLSLPAFSQEEPFMRHEFTAQGFGSFLKTTTNNGIEQSASNSGGVLGTYRFNFNQHHGVEANYGYSLNTQRYGPNGGIFCLNTRSHEATAAYVFRYPLKRFTPFVLAGAGGLIFDPKDSPSIDYQARAAFVYGGGADINFTSHIFVRAEYRGLVYSSPTYNLSGLDGLDRVTHRAEPSAGFGYRF